jgi:general secretion pathway protein G
MILEIGSIMASFTMPSLRELFRGTTIRILAGIALFLTFGCLVLANLGTILGGHSMTVEEAFVRIVIKAPLEAYRMTTGHYPTTHQGLDALTHPPIGVKGWKGPYLNQTEVPKDPWGTPYRYRSPGYHNPDSYDCWSAGPDKKDDTDDDTGNW